MPSLYNKTQGHKITAQAKLATSFLDRLVGLIGKAELIDESLWIKNCNSIHTCFMRFPIDVVFMDQQGIIKSYREKVQPWRFIAPDWSVADTLELPAGTIRKFNIKPGDQLYVDENS